MPKARVSKVLSSVLLGSLVVFSGLNVPSVAKAESSGVVEPDQLYEYRWEITSKTVDSNTYGAWRTGPTGKGPATVSMSQSSSLNISFTNTISGSYTIGKTAISESLGITIGTSETYGTSYAINIPDNSTRTIIYRPKIRTYKVVSKHYRYPVGVYANRTAIKTETSYVDSFSGWDYSYRIGS